MDIWKKILMTLLMLLLVISVAAGIMWHMEYYVMVDFRSYPKDAENLDLRQKKITIEHYEKLRQKLPGCEILWNVPFQGGTVPQDTVQITVESLSEKDVAALAYLPALQTVDARGCGDYTQLLALEQHHPDLNIVYDIRLGGEMYDREEKKITVAGLTEQEIPFLACFPELETVVCTGGEHGAMIQLREYCRSYGIGFSVRVGGTAVSAEAKQVTVKTAGEEDLQMLALLDRAKTIHLVEPQVSAESLIALREKCRDTKVTWEKKLFGVTCVSSEEEIDLSEKKLRDLEKLTREMAYFPDAERVFLGKSSLDNETLADYREQMRKSFKVVWTVELGEKLTARTDDTTFMPVRERVYYFNDEEAYNLRYCEDMVCIDIGHMSIHNIDFVEYMPKLKYLILAHTQLQYIEPIRSCKNLVFLELDWAPIRDLSPLVECTALEDLNVGNVYCSFEPLMEMPWLKNLWMIGSGKSAYQISQALPDTKVQAAGNATVAAGWRDLPNYYDMRDELGMHYMSW